MVGCDDGGDTEGRVDDDNDDVHDELGRTVNPVVGANDVCPLFNGLSFMTVFLRGMRPNLLTDVFGY